MFAPALGVFVCLCRHCAAASVLGHVLIFTVLAPFLFTVLFRTVAYFAGTGVEAVPCCDGTARFEHGLDLH